MPALEIPIVSVPARPVLRLWTDGDPDDFSPDNLSPDGPVANPESESLSGVEIPEKEGRISYPATAWDLRRVLARLEAAWPHSRQQSTWLGFHTLVRYWERYWGIPGPCVSQITPADLQAFFESVDEWGTVRSWSKNLTMLMALFKSVCRASHTNKDGLPRDLESPLRIDDLPFLLIPGDEWFSAHRVKGQSQRGGHTPKRRSTLTRDQFQLVVDAVWSSGVNDPVWWETMLGWLWFTGMRIAQSREQLSWCLDGQSEGIDLQSRTLVTKDSKCGGLIEIPLPECLIPGLGALWHRKKAKYQSRVFLQAGLVTQAPFYAAWNRIWAHAIPCKTEAERELLHFLPHELRAVSVTNWELMPSPDDKAGALITGHQLGNVRMERYFVPGSTILRDIVNRYCARYMPRLRTPPSLFL